MPTLLYIQNGCVLKTEHLVMCVLLLLPFVAFSGTIQTQEEEVGA